MNKTILTKIIIITVIIIIVIILILRLYRSGLDNDKSFKDDRVVLEIMNYHFPQMEFQEDVKREFEKENPDIILKFITMPFDKYIQAIPLLFESGQAPDIFYWSELTKQMHNKHMHKFLSQGWIRPLHPDGNTPQEWKNRWSPDQFVPGINVYENKVYSFSYQKSKTTPDGYMFYNKKMLAEAGLDPEHPPVTWNELKLACKAIKDKSLGAGIAISLDPPNDVKRIWAAIAGSIMTDTYFDYQQGRFCIDDERLLKAYNYIKSFYDDDLVLLGNDPGKPYLYEKTFARQALATGQAAFYFDGYYLSGALNKMGFGDFTTNSLGVARPPYPDKQTHGALKARTVPYGYWVSSQTKYPEEAWRFIEWMTRPTGFFGIEFVSRGFELLEFIDNNKYISDPILLKILMISPGLSVIYPEPIVLNPDLIKSQAFILVEEKYYIHKVISETLLRGGDFKTIARDTAQKQNDLFLQILKKERDSGLNVSAEDYSFPNWNFNEDFNYENYFKKIKSINIENAEN